MHIAKLKSENMKDNIFRDNLVCPKCQSHLIEDDNKLICKSCGQSYPSVKSIVDFREKDAYWCNVSREKMEQLNSLARTSGDWLEAAEKVVPQYANHFKPFYRADCQFLWPTTKDSKILDAGSMWGGITIPAAQFHAEVYAVDQTVETLEFLNIRAEQMGFDNIYTVASGLRKLPFPDDFFDLVVLNGVLEWVAFQQEVVLEKHWKKFGRGLRPEDSVRYTEDPTTMQLQVLQEMQRVLKPGGCLHLAIENRIGYIYLAGWPDDHMNVPFICFMPRFIANAVTKLFLKCPYRTYVYTIPGYKSLLRHSGFGHSEFYGAFSHYIRPLEIVPLDLIRKLKYKIVSTKSGIHKKLIRFVPAFLLKWLAPSIIAIAVKDSGPVNNKPRLIQLLEKAGLLTNGFSGTKIVKCNSRLGNGQTVNYMVYEGIADKPKYFCKVCRSIKDTDILKTEARNLKTIADKLKGSKLNSNIPKLLYFGTIDNITFMVTEFLDGKTYPAKNVKIKGRFLLRKFDKRVIPAIELLAKFQKLTHIKDVKVDPYLIDVIESQEAKLNDKGQLGEDLQRNINRAIEQIKELGNITIPQCAVHGDYDLCNLLFNNGEIALLDFEHFLTEGLPFFDLANLIFNLLLITYGHTGKNMPLSEINSKYKVNRYIYEWLKLYSELSGTPIAILKLIGPIAALEQRTIEYPHYRDPNTYPMFRKPIFEDLITWRP